MLKVSQENDIRSDDIRSLIVCGALLAGEAVGFAAEGFASLWMLPVGLAVLVAFFGYGMGLKGWHFVVLLFVGIALALGVGVEREFAKRTVFWHVREKKAQRVGQWPEVRRELGRRLGIGLERESDVVRMNRAMLLGERLPRRMRKTFVEAGTVHVCAISGLHVGVVLSVLMVLVGLTGLPSRWAGCLALPVVWLYVLLIGSPPSSVRAATMASMTLLAGVFWRKPDRIRAWVVAFLLMYGIRPELYHDIGCALSFAVALALLLMPSRAVALGTRSWARGLMARFCIAAQTSLVASAASIPILAHAFGQLTLGALVANLFIVPAAVFSVTTAFLGLLASFLFTPLAALLNNLSALATNFMIVFSAAITTLPGASIKVCSWTLRRCLFWYLALFLILYLVQRYRKRQRRV